MLSVCVYGCGRRKTNSIHRPKSESNTRTIQYIHPIRPVVERKCLDCSIFLVDVYHFVIVDVNFLLSRLLVKETRC